MTIEEIAILSVLIGSVVVSVWLGFLHREGRVRSRNDMQGY